MERVKYIAASLLIVSVAFGCGLVLAILYSSLARSQPNTLAAEIQAGLSCSAATITLQMRVRELESRLRELEPKSVEQK